MAQRVLYAASTFGHLRSFHLPYLEALRDQGCEVVALAAGEPHGIPEGVRCVAAPFTKRMTSAANVAAARQVAALLRAEPFDLVLPHTSLAAFFVRLGVMAAGRRRPRVVNTVHGYLFDDATPAKRRLVLLGAERLVAGATDGIVTMNAQDTAIARTRCLCRGAVTQVPGMGVPPAGLAPADARARRAARQALGIASDAFVLLFAGEFSARKHQATLVEALAGLPRDVVLALPGAGELREECRALAERLGVDERALMPGRVDDLAPWRAAADVCVSSSRSEGLPFHALEAMACGLPLVLSAVKGHEDLVGAGAQACGALYPFDDVAALRARVMALHDDPALTRRMGAAARAQFGRYALPAVMPQVLAAWGLWPRGATPCPPSRRA